MAAGGMGGSLMGQGYLGFPFHKGKIQKSWFVKSPLTRKFGKAPKGKASKSSKPVRKPVKSLNFRYAKRPKMAGY